MENLINLRNIYFSYQSADNAKIIFQNFNFNLPRANIPICMGLSGGNGSGKTTLLKIIMGLLVPQKGEVEILGKMRKEEKDFLDARQQIGFVFQDADDQLFCPTVEEDIAFGPLNLGLSPLEAQKRSKEILEEIGLSGYGPRITYTLSGGEKKLVALGTALAMCPQLLILDEPTAGLDEAAVERLKNILLKSNLPYLVVSHDKDFLKSTVNEVLHLSHLSPLAP